MNDNQNRGTESGDSTTTEERAQMIAFVREGIVEACADVLGQVQDIAHHSAEGTAVRQLVDAWGLDWLTSDTLALAERLQDLGREATGRVRAAREQVAWLASGGPLYCGSCMDRIEVQWQEWRVCRGWAEHEHCHQDDASIEDAERTYTLSEAEWAAYLDDRTLTGPQAGDEVRFITATGEIVEGWWTLRLDGTARVLGWDGDEYDPAGHRSLEVTNLASQPEVEASSSDATGERS